MRSYDFDQTLPPGGKPLLYSVLSRCSDSPYSANTFGGVKLIADVSSIGSVLQHVGHGRVMPCNVQVHAASFRWIAVG